MRYFNLLGLLMLLTSTKGQVIHIDESFTQRSIDIGSWNYIDSSRNSSCSFADAISQKDWSKVSHKGVIHKQSTNANWVKFDLFSLKERVLFLSIDYVYFDELFLYQKDSQGIELIENLGDFRPPQHRLIKYRLPTFKIHLKGNAPTTYYLYAYQKESVCILPMMLYVEEAFINSTIKSELYNGIVYGCLIIFMIIALISTVYFKSYLYLSYSIYVISGVIFLLANLGNGYQNLWGNNLFLQSYGLYFSVLVGFLSFAAITIQFLKLKKHYKGLYKLLLYSIVTYTATFLILTLGRNLFSNDFYSSALLFVSQSIILFPCLIIFCCTYVYVKSREGKILLFVFIFLIGLSAMILLSLIPLGIVYRSAYHYYKWLFVLECLFIYFILTNDLYQNREMLLTANKALLSTKEEAIYNFIDGQKIERMRVAGNLHDLISLKLASLKMTTATLLSEKKSNKIGSDIDKISEDVRRITHSLSPVSLERYGLTAAIEEDIFRIESTNFEHEIHFTDNTDHEVPKRLEEIIYYSTIELLRNAIKHAKASTIEVKIYSDREAITANVNDNGVGYDPIYSIENGIGLKNIEARVKISGGEFIVNNKEGGGMAHAVIIPYQTK